MSIEFPLAALVRVAAGGCQFSKVLSLPPSGERMQNFIASILYVVSLAAALLHLATVTLTDKQLDAANTAVLRAWDKLDDWKRASTLDWIKSPLGIIVLLFVAVAMMILAETVARSQGVGEWPSFVITLCYVAFAGRPLVAFMMRRSYLPVLVFFVIVGLIFVSTKLLSSARIIGFETSIFLFTHLTLATALLGIVASHHEALAKLALSTMEPIVRWAAQLRGGVLLGLSVALATLATVLKGPS